MAASSGGPDESAVVDVGEEQAFANYVVAFLSTYHPSEEIDATGLQTIVNGLTQWVLDHFTTQERADLSFALSDPGLSFGSSEGQIAANYLAAAIAP